MMHETLATYRDQLFGRDESFAAKTLRGLGRGTNPALAEKSTHLARIKEQARDQDALAAARVRVQRVPWADRPHLNIKEFVIAVGPEALLYWDAVYDELGAP